MEQSTINRKQIFKNLLHICENIKKVRKTTGKSQQEIADLLNIKRSTYAKYELDRIPDIETLVAIGKALNIDWTSLVKETIVGEPIKPGKPGYNDLQAIKENTEAILKELKEMKSNKPRKI